MTGRLDANSNGSGSESNMALSRFVTRGSFTAIWWTAFLLAAAFMLMAAAACSEPSRRSSGEGDNGATVAPTPTSGSATQEPEPTATRRPTVSSSSGGTTPVEGGTLSRLWSDPPTLDPHLTTDATSATIIIEVFGGLVTIAPDLNIIPDLAERWDVTNDGTVYTFHLREDATFHSGKPVTAQDFKWSIERVANPLTAAPVADQYLGDIVGFNERLNGDADEVSGVRVIDEHTLEITIDSPKSYFLAKLTYPAAFVLDRENVETGRRWFREPNGTGPFVLESYVPGEELVLAKHPDYHLGAAHLDSVRFILSGGTSMLMYENGEIHLTGVGIADLDRVLDPSDPLNPQLVEAPPSFSTNYIGMNVNEPPFDDPRVRQALNLAIDKDSIAHTVMAGLVIPAKGILPPGFPGFSESVQGYGYDPERAQRLLAESKYGPQLENFDKPIILTTAGSFGANLTLDMEVILEMWRTNLGIEVEVLQTEFATYLQDLVKRRFEMFEIGWIADYPDPENFLDLLFHSESSNNHTSYSNPEVDKLLEEARVEPDQARRFQLYSQVEQMILDDAPWIPLWNSGEQYVLIKSNVKGYRLTQLIIPKLRFVYFTE